MASSSHNRGIGAVKGGQGLESTPANSSTIMDQVRRSSSNSSNEEGAVPRNEGGGRLDKAKDMMHQAQDAIKDQMHTGNDPKHMKGHTGGGVTQKAQTSVDDTLTSIGRNIGGNTQGEIGGSQLFKKDPAGADESAAGGGLLRKYANETAPGENTS